jgi:urocanate hydratase
MVLDGSLDADRRARSMLHWDVYNGVSAASHARLQLPLRALTLRCACSCQIARRSWAGNSNARYAADREQETNRMMHLTQRHEADAALLTSLIPLDASETEAVPPS